MYFYRIILFKKMDKGELKCLILTNSIILDIVYPPIKMNLNC